MLVTYICVDLLPTNELPGVLAPDREPLPALPLGVLPVLGGLPSGLVNDGGASSPLPGVPAGEVLPKFNLRGFRFPPDKMVNRKQ